MTEEMIEVTLLVPEDTSLTELVEGGKVITDIELPKKNKTR